MEAVVTAVIAALSGLGVLHGRLHSRLHELDRRTDGIEVKIAENYVSKDNFEVSVKRLEDHMGRVESKLDTLLLNRTSR